MAIKLEDKQNVEAPSAQYPYGSIKDIVPNVTPGTPVNRAVYSDIHQFFARLMAVVGISENEALENNTNGFQFIEALATFTSLSNNTTFFKKDFGSVFTGTSGAFGNGVYVLINNTTFIYSTDRVNWTAGSFPAVTGNVVSLAFGNGIFVAGIYDPSTNVETFLTSTDGISWSTLTLSGNPSLSQVVFINGRFFAFSGGIGVSPLTGFRTSIDGLTWTSITHSALSIYDLTYGNGVYVASVSNTNFRIMTSTDAVTWTLQATTDDFSIQIEYGNGVFVSLSTDPEILYSYDGINWDSSAHSLIGALKFGNGKFLSRKAGDEIWESRNGIDWIELKHEALADLNQFVYGNNFFIVGSQTSGNTSFLEAI